MPAFVEENGNDEDEIQSNLSFLNSGPGCASAPPLAPAIRR